MGFAIEFLDHTHALGQDINVLLVISGPASLRAAFAAQHLSNNTFDFNTVCPMPPELDIESSSAVETGYAALYGDWQTEVGLWMFKISAKVGKVAAN